MSLFLCHQFLNFLVPVVCTRVYVHSEHNVLILLVLVEWPCSKKVICYYCHFSYYSFCILNFTWEEMIHACRQNLELQFGIGGPFVSAITHML